MARGLPHFVSPAIFCIPFALFCIPSYELIIKFPPEHYGCAVDSPMFVTL